jgi:hypothetical protein
MIPSSRISYHFRCSDFPGGDGESSFVHRSVPDNVKGIEARRMLGLEPFVTHDMATVGEKSAVQCANAILGFA